MDPTAITLFFVIEVLVDSLLFSYIRQLLESFLWGAVGRSRAKRIWKSFHGWEKVTLSFLKQEDYPFERSFQHYYRLYRVKLYSVLPKYALLVVLNVVFLKHTVILFVTDSVIALTSIVLLLFIRLNGYQVQSINGPILPKYRHARDKESDYHKKRKNSKRRKR